MKTKQDHQEELFYLEDDGRFPNSRFPVVLYRQVLQLPALWPGMAIRRLFARNGWSNSWKSGIYTFHHYHSITHEVLAVCKGEGILQLGGEQGVTVNVSAGDVLILPAGVAHRNRGDESSLICIGAYPGGRKYDLNYGNPGERPLTDEHIRNVPIPETDPVFGKDGSVVNYWKGAEKYGSTVSDPQDLPR